LEERGTEDERLGMGIQIIVGAALCFMGAVHFLPGALEEHYRRHWHDSTSRTRLMMGIGLLLVGVNEIAAGIGAPHLGPP